MSPAEKNGKNSTLDCGEPLSLALEYTMRGHHEATAPVERFDPPPRFEFQAARLHGGRPDESSRAGYPATDPSRLRRILPRLRGRSRSRLSVAAARLPRS